MFVVKLDEYDSSIRITVPDHMIMTTSGTRFVNPHENILFADEPTKEWVIKQLEDLTAMLERSRRPETEVQETAAEAANLMKLHKEELEAMATAMNLPIPEGSHKADIVALIEDHTDGVPEGAEIPAEGEDTEPPADTPEGEDAPADAPVPEEDPATE